MEARKPQSIAATACQTPLSSMCLLQTPAVSVRGPPDRSERTSLLFKRLHRDTWRKSASFDIEYGVHY
jgi:hypothetical protein